MALWTPSAAVALPQFDDADTALAWVDSLKLVNVTVLDDWSAEAQARALAALRPVTGSPAGPSPAGRTWAAALAVPFGLRPGASVGLQFVYAWHFPNRLADFDRFGDTAPPPPGRPGSAIATPPGSPGPRTWLSTSPGGKATCSSALGAGTTPSTKAACPA